MISVTEARQIIQANEQGWGIEAIDIEHASGRILREDIFADRDFPPFDRVTMDGIAIDSNHFNSGNRIFEITDIQTAGEKAKSITLKNTAIEIMTGAILSTNANANVKYEDLLITELNGKRFAEIKLEVIPKWQNVHKKASDRQIGDLLIKKGRKLSPADIAALATVGKSKIKVSRNPKIAIISTGDELVEVNQEPESHQIRMSNSISIQAKLNELGIENKRFHLLDDYASLKIKIKEILKRYDVLLLSGGVSKGKADFIPEVLSELGVEKLFHKVAQRPGKPFWFGKTNNNKCIFALPGNPISTFMCFTVYFLSWLNASLKNQSRHSIKGVLSEDFNFKPDLTYFMQVDVEIGDQGQLTAKPCIGGGSGDLSNLLESNAFLELPSSNSNFKKKDVFELFFFRNL